MNFGGHGVRVGDEQAEGFKRRSVLTLPMLPQAGKREDFVVRSMKELRLLLLRSCRVPFVVAVGGMMQRRDLYADRNDGLVATVSERALAIR